MKKFYTLAILLGFSLTTLAQQPCGTFDYENYLRNKIPGYGNSLDATRQEALSAINKFNKTDNDTVYRIPVVFHIVWNTPAQNIHDSLIYSQIKTLNEAYRHTHKDTGSVRTIFKPVAGDSRIEFFLATKDPNGNPTNGIDRVQTTRADFGEQNGFGEGVKKASSKGADAWNPDIYLNIWVCRFTFSGQVFVAAYAFPPTNAKFWNTSSFTDFDLQGVVINYQYVGTNNPNDGSSGSLREKTLPHEVGHYLGLRHIWADKRNTCVGEDDGLKDTPLANSATTNCNTNKNTCNEGTGDKPDQIENYMDYSPYPCTKMFTKQQVELMRYNLKTLRPNVYQLKVTKPDPTNFANISVFPNPVLGDLTMQFELAGNYEMRLTDYVGRLVSIEKFTIKDNFTYKYNTYGLSSGVYFMDLLLDNNRVYKQKLVIH